MDKLIYTAVSGAEMNQTALKITANNLANITTPGFKADMEQAQAMMVAGDGYRTRYHSQLLPVITDLSAGPVEQTGRDLDIALSENGLLAILDAEGNEAYTRAGHLTLTGEGELLVNGHPVLAEQGPIVLPEFAKLHIGSDGTINLTPPEGGLIEQNEQLKLVSHEGIPMVKGLDGLLRPLEGNQLAISEAVQVRSGSLEGSNVNAIDQMINTMAISRKFEMNIRMMKTADELATTGNQLIRG